MSPSFARNRLFTGFAFLSPWIFSLIVFWYGPILYTVVLSFTDKKLIGAGDFVGFANYAKILSDRMFWIGLERTFLFTIIYLPANLVVGLFVAYIVHYPSPLQGLLRALFYLPAVLPVIAVMVLGKFIFFPQGLINMLLESLGIRGPLWLANARLIIPASVTLMVWQCGTTMVVYLGALKAVPRKYYEAATIDGLGKGGQFVLITLPLISPTIFFRLIIDLIFGLMIFIPGLVLPAGRVPGGPGTGSRFIALHLYDKAFQRFRLGEASALATVLIIVSFFLTMAIIRLGERRVHYEA